MSLLAGMRRNLGEHAANWARRRQGEDTLPLQITRRRIYILPTRAGAGFALLLLGMLVAGLNYNNGLALLLTFLLIAFTLVAMSQCHRNLLGITVEGLHVPASFAAEATAVAIGLQNPGGELKGALRVEIGGECAEAPRLDPEQRLRVSVRIATPVRGRVPLSRIRICTDYPYGLFRAWTWLHLPAAITVYPRARGERAPTGSARGERRRGMIEAAGDDEWATLRLFRAGDSPRHVAWKAYAREQPLLVKEYRGVSSRELEFDFDSLAPLETEARLEQLCRWIVDAEASGTRYGLRLGNVRWPLGRGARHHDACLSALALYQLPQEPVRD